MKSTNAEVLQYRTCIAHADGKEYRRVIVRFDANGNVVRLCLFDEAKDTFDRNIKEIEENNNRCRVFKPIPGKNNKYVVYAGKEID